MKQKERKFEIVKQKDGSVIEKVGFVEKIYKIPVISLGLEIEEITYSQKMYDPQGEKILEFQDEDKHRGVDPHYNPENTEKFRCKGKSEFSRVSLFGETGVKGFDISIIPLVKEDKGISRVFLDVFKEKDSSFYGINTNSLEVHMEREMFNNLKELYLQKNLKSLSFSINFSEGKDIYHDQNLDSDIALWKILNESDVSPKSVEGKIRRINLISHPQSLIGSKSGEKY